MNRNLENILTIVLSIAISFIFYINIGISNKQMLQYIILLPVLLIYIFDLFIYKKRKPNIYLVAQLLFLISIYFLTANKFGMKFKHILSVSGFLIIPIMIIIFSQINIKSKNKVLKYFLYFFSIIEIILIILKITYGSFIGFEDLTQIRSIFPSWPNYFAIISAIKIGIATYFYRIRNIKRNFFLYFLFLSSIIIFLSLSRTGILMMAIIIILNTLLSLENLNFKTIFIKNRKKVILIFSFILIIATIFIIKGSLGNNQLMKTLSSRFGIWNYVLPFIRNNFFIGMGFRSTFDTLGLIGGKVSTHNDYIDILLKSGIIGFILIYTYFLRRTWILMKKDYHEFVSIIIAVFIAGLFQNPLKDLSIMIIFTLLLSYSYKEVHR